MDLPFAAQQKGVRTQHPDYIRLAPKWKRCADCVDGQDAMHAAGVEYLPMLKEESTEEYRARLRRSDFFAAGWRTIAGLAGMAFASPPSVEVPAAIEVFLPDIDMAGNSLDDMARTFVEDMLEFGMFGLMVDYPPMPENVAAITSAAAEVMGLRPAIKYYDIRSVTNWRYDRRSNAMQLVMVTLREAHPVHEDEFSHKTEDRYRVLDLDERGFYRQRVYRVDKRGNDELVEGPVYPAMRGKPLPYLPFRIVGRIDEPPLIDLFDANVAHYQVNSDYRHGLHFTGMPTAVVSGYTQESDEKLYIGSKAAWVFPDPQARAAFLEFTGQGLEPTERALKALEQRMAILGARMIADETRQAETLGATQIKRQGENSILATVANDVSRAIEWALGIVAEWVGASGAVRYEINRDYNPARLTAQELTAMLGLVQAGEMSSAEFYAMLQRADIVDPAKPFDEHQEEVASQGPASPSAGVAA